MTLTAILLLILTGLVLLILEILFVPGMILGIISVILMIIGVIFSFKDHGSTTGYLVLAGTAVATAIAVYWAFTSGIWQKMGVQATIDGKANELDEAALKPGASGITISRLNPIGKARVNHVITEVYAMDGFIDQDKEIEVVKVDQNKVVVRLKA